MDKQASNIIIKAKIFF